MSHLKIIAASQAAIHKFKNLFEYTGCPRS